MTDVPPEQPAAPSGQEILAIVLDKPTRAEQVLLALAHLQGEGKLRMHDAVIVAKDASGQSRTVETVDVTPAKGAVAGGWFGLLASFLIGGPVGLGVMAGGIAAGALYGKLVDRGLEDGWVKDMADWIDPETSALLLLVDAGFHPDVLAELRRFEGTGEIAYSTLPEGVRSEIEAALEGGNGTPGA
ncbi:MAG: DUF1269 domain-containing protein [Acidimicrobiia bacterium]|nr:DUF1269 domain-containing protein [Acidimicrobiia bacterium]